MNRVRNGKKDSKNETFIKVLSIGPQYQNYKGGIGAVLATYATYVDDFKFITTYNENYNRLENLILFVSSLFKVSSKLVFDKEIKIVHIHGASKGSFFRKYLIYLLCKSLFRKKIIYHIHGGGYEKFYNASSKIVKSLVKNLIESADCVICLSRRWLEYYQNNFNARRIELLFNPVGTSNNQRKKERLKGTINLLFLGKIHDDKGVFDLLNIIIENKETYRGKLKLYIGGVGEAGRLQKLIESNQAADIVEYIGWVTDESKQAYLSSCDALILPSYYEGLPISILEAMSYGKVVLASNVGGIPEIVEHGENGYLFEPGDLNAIHKYLVEFINNRQKTITMGCKSLPKVNPYLAPNVMKQLAGIYQSILV